MRPPLPVRLDWRRAPEGLARGALGLGAMLRRNWRLKLAALGLSLLFWALASTGGEREEEQSSGRTAEPAGTLR